MLIGGEHNIPVPIHSVYAEPGSAAVIILANENGSADNNIIKTSPILEINDALDNSISDFRRDNFSSNTDNNDYYKHNKDDFVNGDFSNNNHSDNNTNMENTYNIRINETILVNSSYREKDTGLEETVGETVSSFVTAEAKNSSINQGFSKIREFSQAAGILTFQKAEGQLYVLQYEKLKSMDLNNSFKDLNIILAEKHVNGIFERDTTGLLANGLRYDTLEASMASADAVMEFLNKKGLVTKRVSDGGAYWDTTRFERLYQHEQFDELSRIIDFNPNRPATARLNDLKNINEHVKMYEYSKFLKMNYIRNVKKTLHNLTKKNLQDTSIYRGYSSSTKILKIIKKTFYFASFISLVGKRMASTRIGKFTVNKIIKPSLNKSKFGQRILNKETKLQKANAKLMDKYNSINDKMFNNISAKSRKKINKKITKKGKVINGSIKQGKFAQKIAHIFKSLSKLLTTVAAWIGIALAIILLLQFCIILITSICSLALSFFDSESTAESTANQTFRKLQEYESEWVSGLKDINEDDKFDLSSIYYTDEYLTMEEYANIHPVLSYSDNKFLAPYPFGLTSGDEGLRKKFTYVDGGVEISFKGIDGGTNKTSNIKDILSLSQAYYLNDIDDLKEYVDDLNVAKSSQKNALIDLKKSTNKMQAWMPEYSNKGKDNYKILEAYTTLLFNGTHQESFNLDYALLPTKKDYGDMEEIPENICNPKINDGYGCMTYDHFYYEDNSMYVNNINVSGYVTPKDEKDNCCPYDPYSIESFEDAYVNHKDCYLIESPAEIWYEDYYYYKEIGTVTASIVESMIEPANNNILVENNNSIYSNNLIYANATSISDKFKNEIANYCSLNGLSFDEEDFSISLDGEGGYYVMTAVDHDLNKHSETLILGNTIYKYTEAEKRYTKLHITHNCAHNHTGYYCGGHLKMYVDATVYGITENMLGENEGDIGEIIPKIEGEYIPYEGTDYLIDVDKLNSSVDIFDIDAAIQRPYEPDNWDGWNDSNMQLAILKYSMDWEDLYGLTFSEILGGVSYSVNEIKYILNQIKTQYPDLNEERLLIIENALNKCGNIGYSQVHHSCPLEGPCPIYGEDFPCYLSDCSGFVSNLWDIRYSGKIFSTYDYWNTYSSSWLKFYNADPIPGDILLYYGGNAPGGGDDHALLFLGYIQIDEHSTPNNYSIDCTTEGGVGNVYLKSRSYYYECYVVKPDK